MFQLRSSVACTIDRATLPLSFIAFEVETAIAKNPLWDIARSEGSWLLCAGTRSKPKSSCNKCR